MPDTHNDINKQVDKKKDVQIDKLTKRKIDKLKIDRQTKRAQEHLARDNLQIITFEIDYNHQPISFEEDKRFGL